MEYRCSVCDKVERVSPATGETDVKPREVWLDRPIYRCEPTARWGAMKNELFMMQERECTRTMVFAHAECVEQFRAISELRKVLNTREPWQEKQHKLYKALTNLTDLMGLLPDANEPDWRHLFVIPEDYYTR